LARYNGIFANSVYQDKKAFTFSASVMIVLMNINTHAAIHIVGACFGGWNPASMQRQPASPFPGNLNKDGSVNITDISALKDFIISGHRPVS
jgi:hypothetical protein